MQGWELECETHWICEDRRMFFHQSLSRVLTHVGANDISLRFACNPQGPITMETTWATHRLAVICLLVMQLLDFDQIKLSRLFCSGHRCWRLLLCLLRDGAKPSGWQHGDISIRGPAEGNVYHPCLHCLHHGQTRPEYSETGRVFYCITCIIIVILALAL